MPRLNGVLEELGIHHEERVVPQEVLNAIEEKKKKAATKNVTAAAESKKREGMGGPKALAKKQKASAVVTTPAASSACASGSAEEGSTEGTGGGGAESTQGVDKPAVSEDVGGGRGLEGVERPEPSAANPMPAVMGGDSSSDEAEDAGHGVAAPPKDAETEGASRRRPATAEVEEQSEDEAISQHPAGFRSATFRQLQPAAFCGCCWCKGQGIRAPFEYVALVFL